MRGWFSYGSASSSDDETPSFRPGQSPRRQVRSSSSEDETPDADANVLERRPDDLARAKFMRIKTTYGTDIDGYVRTFRGFVLESWRLACQEKDKLALTFHRVLMIADESSDSFMYSPYDRRGNHRVHRVIEFDLPHGQSSGDSSDSPGSRVEAGDGIRLTCGEDEGGAPLQGKVLNVSQGHVIANIKCRERDLPYGLRVATRNQAFECDIKFVLCDVIYRRQALALESLKKRPATDVIRQSILGQTIARKAETPVVIKDASYKSEDCEFKATPAQTEAVSRLLNRPFTLVQGPPGTGKTRVIAAMVFHLLSRRTDPTQKILVCGTSNAAVQNLAAALLPAVTAARGTLLWLAAASRDVRPSADLPPEYESFAFLKMLCDDRFCRLQVQAWERSLRGAAAEALAERREQLEKELCGEADVVCCTLETAARECMTGWQFSTVLMDEATQAVEPSALIPLIYGAKRVALVGDQCQLGPVITERTLEDNGYGQSLFERLIAAKIDYVMLDRQFRMHPQISAFPNKQFYFGKIQNGITEAQRRGPVVRCFKNPDVPILFLDSQGEESTSRSSFENWEEGEIVDRVIRTLLTAGVKSSQIGVIAPYRGQVELLEKRIRPDPEMHPGMKIATVDSFQGGECDYIVMSCVRNGTTIGFLKDKRRMNVSLTRARYGLVIVGNRETLARYSPDWSGLCSHFVQKSAMIREGGETVRASVAANTALLAKSKGKR